MTISFEAIRAQAQIATGATVQAAQASTHKVVQVAKSVGSAIGGVLPATNNRVNGLEENVAVTIAALKLEIDQLRAQVGMPAQPIAAQEVNDMASAILGLWGAKKEPARVQVAPEAPQVAPEAPQQLPAPTTASVVEQAVQSVPEAQQMTIEEVQPQSAPSIPAPTNPMANAIPLSQPSNWHLGAGAQI